MALFAKSSHSRSVKGASFIRRVSRPRRPPYLQDKQLPCDPNLPIGIMPDWTFSEQETDIAPGSTVFLYTDGLTEAENARADQFGRQRVIDIISSSIEGVYSPHELIETMTAAVRQFIGETEQSDDLTMLAIKYTKG
ncbi:MAG: serine/threonine-protein phosphatase [Prevotella sp.]|nr:serine/threonine-protein phosphatase [Prevotella sp.]